MFCTTRRGVHKWRQLTPLEACHGRARSASAAGCEPSIVNRLPILCAIPSVLSSDSASPWRSASAPKKKKGSHPPRAATAERGAHQPRRCEPSTGHRLRGVCANPWVLSNEHALPLRIAPAPKKKKGSHPCRPATAERGAHQWGGVNLQH